VCARAVISLALAFVFSIAAAPAASATECARITAVSTGNSLLAREGSTLLPEFGVITQSVMKVKSSGDRIVWLMSNGDLYGATATSGRRGPPRA
jgi:hypothetical protein